MAKTPENGCEGGKPSSQGASCGAPDINAWFVREVLPLEAAVKRFLYRGWRNDSDVSDLCQDVFVQVYEAAQTEIPRPAKPFVFATARNLLINRMRRAQIVSIEAVADLDSLGLAADDPGPDRAMIARDELRRLQVALDNLPPRRRHPRRAHQWGDGRFYRAGGSQSDTRWYGPFTASNTLRRCCRCA